MKDKVVDEIYKMTEHQIKDIAFNRRAIEILDGDVIDFDSKMNDWCEKYYAYFEKMNEIEMSKYMYEETLRMLGDVEGA